jgi:hypothetical protein
MKRFACWQEREVDRTLVDDANRDAPAVFSAVHRPAPVMRKDIRSGGADPGTPVSEHDVLEALVGGNPERDVIVPIVGESGTGKSHLIRWLDANIERTDHRHVVYIEKRGTSLRQVIHKILEGLDRPEVSHRKRFQELRADVDKAAAGLNPDTARLRLLNELALAIREHGADTYLGEEERADREELAKGLPDLLMDPEFRAPLLADGDVIAATVDKALGKGGPDGEAPAFEDLNLEIRDVLSAGKAARDVRQDLFGSTELRELAVRMLNEQLNHAVGALIGVDRTRIYDVMLNVRETLLEEGKMLVLLVEDFALLRGVETQLLDAMIADAESQGNRVLCPIRSALAVTRGYFEGKETALTRIASRGEFEYSLDVQLAEGGGGVSNDYVHTFVATYLNAARVGRDKLEASFAARSAPHRRWVDNACESCTYVAECHEAFGVADGYGLYPFNGHALDRIITSQTDRFDPRHILQILDRTLRTQRQKLIDGEFPDPDWAEQYEQQKVPGRPELPYLPAAVATTYEDLDPGTAQRRKTLVTFWGGVPQRAVNLSETIHEAFDLPPLAGLERDEGQQKPAAPAEETPRAPAPGGQRATESPVTDKHARDNLALDRWGKGQVLEQALANEVRKALATAVRGAREWSALGVDPVALDRLVVNPAFSLGPHAMGEGAGTRTLGKLDPSDANAFLLQGVLAAERGGDWAFDRGLERLASFSEHVEAWADQALSLLQPDGETAIIAQLLLLAGAALGLAGPDDPADKLLASLFSEGPAISEDAKWGTFQWRLATGPSGALSRAELIDKLGKDHRLRRSVEAKHVIAIDSGPLMAAIEALGRNGWLVPTEDDLAHSDRGVQLYADALRRDLIDEVQSRLRELAAMRERQMGLLGDVRDPAQIAAAVGDAYNAARESGVGAVVPGVDRAELELRFSTADVGVLDRLADLERLDELSWSRQLALAVAAEREDLDPIDRYCEWADRALNASTEQAEAYLGGEDETTETITSSTAKLLTVLRALADELDGAPQ